MGVNMVNLSVSRLFKVGSIPEAITEGIVEKAQALRTAGKEVTPEAVFTLVKKDPKLLQNIAVSYSEYLAKEMASGASHNAARASFIREIVRDQKFAESVRANPDGLRALYKEASDVLNEAEKLAPGYAKAANKPTQVQEFAQRALTSGKASAEDFQTMFNQLNTNGKIFAGSANDLGRKEYTKVPKILEAIRDGERVTLTEIERLRSNITRGSANVASVTHPGPGTTAGGAMGWLGHGEDGV